MQRVWDQTERLLYRLVMVNVNFCPTAAAEHSGFPTGKNSHIVTQSITTATRRQQPSNRLFCALNQCPFHPAKIQARALLRFG